MRSAVLSLAGALLVAACNATTPEYSLTGNETGIFHSNNAGRPIPVSQIKGMDERQLVATFGAPELDRKDASTRVLRYRSDGCTMFVFLKGDQAEYVDSYDPQLRPLINTDQCAGSVAAQRRAV